MQKNEMPPELKAAMDLIAATPLMPEPDFYPVSVPDGVSGFWEVMTVRVPNYKAIADNMMHIQNATPEHRVYPGVYKILKGPMGVMMSNTQMEYQTAQPFMQAAKGTVLISGLGLGMLLRPLAELRRVSRILVIEKEQDVINLVAPHYADIKKLEIVHGDAFTYELDAGYRFSIDIAFHDIWPTVSSKNLPEMGRLRKLYAVHAKEQMFWVKDLCERAKNREQTLYKMAREACKDNPEKLAELNKLIERLENE